MAAGPLSRHPRAEAMARRLGDTAQRAGLDVRVAARLADVFLAVIDRRARGIDDGEHHAFLHPARTALILMDDAGVRDPAALSAGLLLESIDRGLRPDAGATASLLDADAAALLAAVPLPEASLAAGETDAADARARLLERLVTADRSVALIAIAEHLDQARHLHFRLRAAGYGAIDHAAAAGLHALSVSVYQPVAGRTDALLAARLARWAGAFERRFLGHRG
jgi:hypothetical protein